MLATSEYEEIFRILKRNNESYTENSNGIFFDVMIIKNETYTDMEKFMLFCLKTRQNDVDRQKELEEYRDEIKG